MGCSKSKFYFTRCLPVSNARHKWQGQLEVGIWHQREKSCIEIYTQSLQSLNGFEYNIIGRVNKNQARSLRGLGLSCDTCRTGLMRRKKEESTSSGRQPLWKKKKKTTAMLAEDRSLLECDKLCWTELTRHETLWSSAYFWTTPGVFRVFLIKP